jgi:hypothetical protein
MAFAIRVSMGARAPHVLAAAAILVWSGSSHSASAACVVPSDTAVISVQRIPAPESGSERLLQLGDRIAIKVKNLGDLLKDPNCTLKAALFLDGQAVKGLNSFQSTDDRDVLVFDLGPTPESAAVWKHVFTNPFDEGWQREIALNVGWQDQGAFPGKPSIQRINLFPEGWAFFFLVLLLALLAIFAGLAINSGLLRNSPPPPDTVKVTGDQLDWTQPPPDAGPYSLGRTQAAWWLFIILAAYILIGLVTGNFASSINSTALTLLGIGAATAVGGVVISQSKKEDQQARARTLLRRITDLQELGTMNAVALATRTPVVVSRHAELSQTYPEAARAAAAGLDAYIRRNAVDYAVATNQGSRGFLLDILSDADGVSVHRFQLFAWTIILGVVFVSAVLREVAMPVFSATLLGLMGLSAGTYLGLKIPESTVPKQPPTQP